MRNAFASALLTAFLVRVLCATVRLSYSFLTNANSVSVRSSNAFRSCPMFTIHQARSASYWYFWRSLVFSGGSSLVFVEKYSYSMSSFNSS